MEIVQALHSTCYNCTESRLLTFADLWESPFFEKSLIPGTRIPQGMNICF